MGKNNQNPKDEKTLLEQNIAGLRYEMERLTDLLGVAIRNDSIKKDERVLFDFSDDQANERTIDDIIGKYDGVIVCDGSPREVFSDVEKMRTLGLDVPQATYLAYLLRKRGLPVKQDVLNAEECIKELEKICR